VIDLEQEIQRVKYNLGRAKRAGTPATLTLDEWLTNIELFNGLCAYCCKRPFTILDHLQPLTLQGGTTQENSVPSCSRCNLYKSDLFVEQTTQMVTLLEKVETVRHFLQEQPSWEDEEDDYVPRPPMDPDQLKKRTNMYFNEDDKAYIALIKEHYNLTSDAAAVRLAIKRVAEEIKRDVSGTPRKHREDQTSR